MAENEGLERVVRLEKKLDALSISVEERFNEVRDHFVEQREYSEFAYDRLDRRISEGLAHLEQRMSEGFAAFDQRMSEGFAASDRCMSDGFAAVDQRFVAVDQRITGVKQELTEGLARMERKLDRLIDSQTKPRATKSRRLRPSKRRR